MAHSYKRTFVFLPQARQPEGKVEPAEPFVLPRRAAFWHSDD